MSKRITDQLGRVIHLEHIPKRIISLVPSQTELLCDLGLKFNIVGVTKFCIHPSDIKNLGTVVGGTKQIHIEKIKVLNPDIIVCNKEENTKEIVEDLERICPVHVSDIYTLEDSIELITQYGEIFNRKQEVVLLRNKIKEEVNGFNKFISNFPTLKVAYFIWKNPWMVAANNTFINYLLQLNRFENVYTYENRYPEIHLTEKNVNKDVELILLSTEPYPFKNKHREELSAYYPNAKIIVVDGEMFSWYGSRLVKAFEYFKKTRLSLQDTQPY